MADIVQERGHDQAGRVPPARLRQASALDGMLQLRDVLAIGEAAPRRIKALDIPQGWSVWVIRRYRASRRRWK